MAVRLNNRNCGAFEWFCGSKQFCWIKILSKIKRIIDQITPNFTWQITWERGRNYNHWSISDITW